MKTQEFNFRINKKTRNLCISCENNGNHENDRIPCKTKENHEHLRSST